MTKTESTEPKFTNGRRIIEDYHAEQEALIEDTSARLSEQVENRFTLRQKREN